MFCLAKRQMKAAVQGQRWGCDELASCSPDCALNCRIVFPGICHIEDMGLLIGNRVCHLRCQTIGEQLC